MSVARGKYVIERLPDAPEKWTAFLWQYCLRFWVRVVIAPEDVVDGMNYFSSCQGLIFGLGPRPLRRRTQLSALFGGLYGKLCSFYHYTVVAEDHYFIPSYLHDSAALDAPPVISPLRFVLGGMAETGCIEGQGFAHLTEIAFGFFELHF